MRFAVLEFTDFAGIVAVPAGGAAAARALVGAADPCRLARMWQKLDLLLTDGGLEYTPAAKSACQALADDGPTRKIVAIKVYPGETGVAEVERGIGHRVVADVTPNEALRWTGAAMLVCGS